MPKLLISLMAASLLLPAAVFAEDGDLLRGMRNEAERSSRADNSSERRSARTQPSQRVERSSDDRPAEVIRTIQPERQPRVGGERNGAPGDIDRGVRRVGRVHGDDQATQQIEPVERPDADRGFRRVERVGRISRAVPQVVSDQSPEQVQAPQIERRRQGQTGASSQEGRDIIEPGARDRDGGSSWHRDRDGDRDWRRDRVGRHDWSRDWRRDGRYDWSSHRNRYRSLFRLGRYNDPYAWGYRRFSTGFSLWPSYYGSSFWLDDPWRYRLPPAYGQYRWIRYYGDALLVDINTGQVMDVVHNVFW